MFGRSESEDLPPLNEEQKFLLEEFRLGLIPEEKWRALLDRDPTLSAHVSGRE